MESNETRARGHRKTRIGYVESDKMDKTVVVSITRRFRHPKYKKFVKDRTRYKAHDETNTAKVGDKVRIIESRPLSRDKRCLGWWAGLESVRAE